MREKALGIALLTLFRTLYLVFPPQQAKETLDDIMDQFEDRNEIWKAACKYVRETWSIPDDIGGDPD